MGQSGVTKKPKIGFEDALCKTSQRGQKKQVRIRSFTFALGKGADLFLEAGALLLQGAVNISERIRLVFCDTLCHHTQEPWGGRYDDSNI